MNISTFLNYKGYYSFEGNSQEIPEQVEVLKAIVNNNNVKNVMEIGFNAGHSAEFFLHFNKSLKLTSFDLGVHDYVLQAKEYIDVMYPNRHELILGDSTITVPKYFENNKNIKFDVIFIDGMHQVEYFIRDLNNSIQYLSHDGIIFIDDIIPLNYNEQLKIPIKHYYENNNNAYLQNNIYASIIGHPPLHQGLAYYQKIMNVDSIYTNNVTNAQLKLNIPIEVLFEGLDINTFFKTDNIDDSIKSELNLKTGDIY